MKFALPAAKVEWEKLVSLKTAVHTGPVFGAHSAIARISRAIQGG